MGNTNSVKAPSEEAKVDTEESAKAFAIGRTERLIRHREHSRAGMDMEEDDKAPLSSRTERQSRTLTKEEKIERRRQKKLMQQSIKDRQSNKAKEASPDLDVTGRLMASEVSNRRDTCAEVKKTTIKGGEITIEYAHSSQRGYYPDDPHKPNQDALSVTHNLSAIADDSYFAIFDGHGPVGEHFATYAQKNLPSLMAKYIQQERVKAHKLRNSKLPKDEQLPFNPKLFPMISTKSYQEASKNAHIELNGLMIDTQPLVNLSGSTAISAGFHDGQIIVSNVGDSRAILGYYDSEEKKTIAVPLSQDQTPWRRDERERIERSGGRVLTVDQLEGKTEVKESDKTQDKKLGVDDFIDIAGDPPRVWKADDNLPGTSFTRSLGDSIAEECGVFAEPEFFSKRISEEDEILVLASDGVFEFMTNQEIIDMCKNSENAVIACDEIVHKAYNSWLEHENRTDDITIIVMYFRHNEN